MSWTWVRPADPSVLDGRPLLDLGCGDGQTLAALVRRTGLVLGMDVSFDALRAARRSGARLVCGVADRLPLRAGTMGTVLAGDLFHHLDEDRLRTVLAEVRRVLRDGGQMVAWWYEQPGRDAPDAPRYPRSYVDVADAAAESDFVPAPLTLELTLEQAPPTAGILATR